jgi:hypothetical protein
MKPYKGNSIQEIVLIVALVIIVCISVIAALGVIFRNYSLKPVKN